MEVPSHALKSIVRRIKADFRAARLRITETQTALPFEVLLFCIRQNGHQLVVRWLKTSNMQIVAKLFE